MKPGFALFLAVSGPTNVQNVHTNWNLLVKERTRTQRKKAMTNRERAGKYGNGKGGIYLLTTEKWEMGTA